MTVVVVIDLFHKAFWGVQEKTRRVHPRTALEDVTGASRALSAPIYSVLMVLYGRYYFNTLVYTVVSSSIS